MDTILFITLDDILHYTVISGNIDDNRISAHIYNSQVLYTEPLIGSDLYEKLETMIADNSINNSGNTNYKTLLLKYLTPSIVFHTMEIFSSLNSFYISSAGVIQHQISNAQTSDLNEIDRISNKYRTLGAKYDSKLDLYLKKNANLFPEYQNNTGLVKKTEVTSRSGWYLGTNNQTSKIRI